MSSQQFSSFSGLKGNCQGMPSWEELQHHFPEISRFFQEEHKKIGGFIPFERGYVYLIHAVGTDYYKVGKSINPDQRILQIAPKMPFDVRFIRVWRSEFMSLAEKMVHKELAECRVNGEWFQLTRDWSQFAAASRSGAEPGYVYTPWVLSEGMSFLIRNAYFCDIYDRIKALIRNVYGTDDHSSPQYKYWSCKLYEIACDGLQPFVFKPWVENMLFQIDEDQFQAMNLDCATGINHPEF